MNTVQSFDMKGAEMLALNKDLDSVCQKKPITTLCLTILMDLSFPKLAGDNSELTTPSSRKDNCRLPAVGSGL